MRKHEGFLSLKRDLALVVQAAHKAEEIVISSHRLAKDEESSSVVVVKAFEVAEKKSQDLAVKLAEVNHDKKSIKAALDVVERQTEAQRKQLCQAKDDLATAKGQIKTLAKKLEEVEKAKEQAEQEGYNVGVAETEEALRAEVSEASSALRSAENVYYLLAIHASGSSSYKVDSASKEVDKGKESPRKTLPPIDIPSEVAEQAEDAEKVDDTPRCLPRMPPKSL
ncbi:hypothetical protein SO802_026629 [Lithocarpus litseifolius]|uniref:Uncharacterized protein n=1 Tax=Lithocarpus litseifolius TaxID=425828 RepID=A0AAW2C0A6_9ROSI